MKERNHKGQFRASETAAYKMTQHHGFDQVSWQAFQEAATDKYDFGACKEGEKMTFGKCQKVGGSSKKKEVPSSLKQSKATLEAQLASAKKRGNKPQMAKAQRALASVNAKIDSYQASESEDEASFKSGCPDGFRSKGSKTISGKRREVCCTPDGKVCMTADGIPL